MKIKKVEYVENYKLRLSFNNGSIKVVDLEDTIKTHKGIFLPLLDLDYFKKVTLDDCQLSICWPNGADICPDLLYSIGRDIKETIKPKKGLRRKKSEVKSLSTFPLAKKPTNRK